MRKTFFYCLILFTAYKSHAQTDNIGPGHALYFNGNKGFVDFGDVYNKLTFPFTISFWVKLDARKNDLAAIFATEEGSFEYRGFWVRLTKTNIGLGWGDGLGGNNPKFRRVKQQNVEDLRGRWNHICFVATTKSDIIIYLNGINIGGSFTGTSPNNMLIDASDEARIGKFYSNGETWQMQGSLDEMRLWNYSRTAQQIRRDMCKRLSDHEEGLIGYWNFNEINGSSTTDLSDKKIDGEITGDIDRVYSGAPIGDESVYSYSQIEGLSLAEGSDKITVTNLSSDVEGLHIYKINNPPSQIDISDSDLRSYYYGVFPATTTAQPTTYNLEIEGACALAKRNDNSEPSWSAMELENYILENEVSRGEYILKSNAEDLYLLLEEDTTICNTQTYLIEPEFSEASAEYFFWQDGTSSATFTAKKSGLYWFEIGNQCGTLRDSINVTFSQGIKNLDLGPDQAICENDQLVLKPKEVDENITSYLWQDGSTMPSLNVNAPGEYWLEAGNSCGFIRDTVRIALQKQSDVFIPNIITPNNDPFNEYFKIDKQITNAALRVFNRWGTEVFASDNYHNNWNGNGLSPGVYFFKIKDRCSGQEYKGPLTIMK